jgi:heptosyltransferase-3
MNLRVARYIDRWVGFAVCLALWSVGRAWTLLRGRPHVPGLLATTPPGDTPPPAPRRVLAIKFYGLGNIAMILPTLQALNEALPGVEIDFLTLPGNRSLLAQSGLVRRTLTVEVGTFGRFLGSALRLFSELVRGRYDAVLDFEQFMKLSSIFAFLTGAPVRVGFNTEGQARGWLYSHRIAYADTDHMADIFMRLAKPIEAARHPAPHVRIPVDAADHERARTAVGLVDGVPLVTMHVGTGPNYDKIALKRWDTSRFAALADALVERCGARIAFTGQGEEEAHLIEQTIAVMRRSDAALSVCDQLSVGELTALLAASRFVVSNDTSIMHLTGLVGTPVVAFFGPTEPRIYGPRGEADLVFYKGLYCSPCLSNYNLKMSRCVNPVCMRRIEVDEVLAGISRQLLAGPAPLVRAASR